ncbi:MAG: ATP-binding protein [Pseudomonadota bacterium]
MYRLYPKSFLRLILIGFALVALPLLFALGNAAYTVQRLAQESRRAVDQATVAARSQRGVAEILTGMERVLRQFVLLHDERLLEDYRRMHGEFKQLLADYGALPLNAEQRLALQRVTARADGLLARLDGSGAAQSAARRDEVAELVAMGDEARRVIGAGRAVIEGEVERLQAMAQSAHNLLLWQLLAAVAIALVIALWFRYVISRQIEQVDRAIRTIGRAEYSDGISVAGPQDLAYLGRRLDWLRRRLAELEEQKSRFLRHVSHDLKTPLTAIREGVQLLSEGVPGPLNDQQRTIVDILTQNSKRLQRQIEDLLNYQQAGFAANTIDPQPVALDVVCTKVFRTQRVVLAARGIRVERKLAPVIVEGDAEKLRVVVDNLMTNAIKFSPRGGTIRMELRQAEDSAVLDVMDEGPGVAPEDREKIFEPFFRGTQARKGGVKGSGLGLAIAKEYVIAHRGRIQVVGGEGKGGHFRLTLPLEWKKTE